VGFIYSSESDPSRTAYSALSWIYNTIWRIPIEGIDVSSQTLSAQTLSGIESKYSIVVLLACIDGIDRIGNAGWKTLSKLNATIPVVTFGKTIMIDEAKSMFGCSYLQQARVEYASISTGHALTRNLSNPMSLLGQSFLGKADAGAQVLIHDYADSNKVLATAKGMYYWIGIAGILDTRLIQNIDLMKLAENILALNPFGYVRLSFAYNYVAIRVDDVPFTTESWFWGWKYFDHKGWKRFFEVLRRHGAKADLMIVPFNVSKSDGRWVAYNETHSRELEEIRIALANGVIEIGAHGATHMTPFQHFFIEERSIDPMKLTSVLRYEFGLDANTGKQISFEVQKEHLKILTKVIGEWFSVQPTVFTPPWHVYDVNTLIIARQLGYKYVSADLRFGKGMQGQPQSIMGQNTSDLIMIPVNLIWESTDPNDVDSYRRRLDPLSYGGIPFVFIAHGRNWTYAEKTYTFSLSHADELLSALDRDYRVKYLFLSELGEAFDRWSKVHVAATMTSNSTSIIIRTPVEMEAILTTSKPGKDVASATLDGSKIDLTKGTCIVKLPAGSHSLVVSYKEILPIVEEEPPSIWLISLAVLIILINSIVVLCLHRIRNAFNRRSMRRIFRSASSD